MDASPSRQGRIEVVCGPMFAGKSEELHRRLRRALYAKQHVLLVTRDTRHGKGVFVTHDGRELESRYVETAEDIFPLICDNSINVQVLGIDEGQFFGDGLKDACSNLAGLGVRVIVSGLDMDFQETPFQNMASLMGVAEEVDKLTAICVECGAKATRSYRKVASKERVLEGAGDEYDPLCRACYVSKQAL